MPKLNCEYCGGSRYIIIEEKIEYNDRGEGYECYNLEPCLVCNHDGLLNYYCCDICEAEENREYYSLDQVPIGSLVKANREYWGEMLMPNDGDVIFKIISHVPSKIYPRDGVVLEQISGPEHDILFEPEPGEPDYDEDCYNEKNSFAPNHPVAEDEPAEWNMAFIVIKNESE